MINDKNNAPIKVRAHGKSPTQIQEIERASIRHIRSISEDLFSIMNQLDHIQPSICMPSASPIHRKLNTVHSNQNASDEDQLIAFSFLKNKVLMERSKQSERGKIGKKGSVPAVHYASYMKPTHHMKEKIREILINEKEQKELERERELRKIEELKQKANKNYTMVQSRYCRYDEQKADKAEAIAARLMEKELLQMSEVTFKPNINQNVKVKESFEQRLIVNSQKKKLKEGEIIKDMIKGHTYKPKINSHKVSESKVKKMWSNSSSPDRQRLSKTQQLSLSLFSSSPPVKEELSSHVKASAADFDFVIDQTLFNK